LVPYIFYLFEIFDCGVEFAKELFGLRVDFFAVLGCQGLWLGVACFVVGKLFLSAGREGGGDVGGTD